MLRSRLLSVRTCGPQHGRRLNRTAAAALLQHGRFRSRAVAQPSPPSSLPPSILLWKHGCFPSPIVAATSLATFIINNEYYEQHYK